MGARKKNKHARGGRGVDTHAIREHMQQIINAEAPPSVPKCLTKLSSANPAEREEGCIDLAQFALIPAHHTALVHHNAHRRAAQLLTDCNVHVVNAAAAALRNLLTNGHDELADEVVSQDNAAVVVAGILCQYIDQQPAMLSAVTELEKQGASESEPVENNDETASPLEQASALLLGLESAAEECFQLASVLAEVNESAFTQVFSTTEFLSHAITAVCNMCGSHRESSVAVAVAAAECLHLLSSENDALAHHLHSQLSAEQHQLLNLWIQGGPGSSTGPDGQHHLVISPRLLRFSLALAGTLWNSAPNDQNVARVLPVVCYALQTLPLKEWGRVLPLLSEDCTMSEEVRSTAVSQSTDRFRSLQAALDIMASIIGYVCEQHDDNLDDESAFAQNPHAAILTTSGAFQRVGDILKDILQPYPDAIAMKALRETTPNGDAATIQHLFLSVEVGLFGLASTLLMMLPVTSLGTFPAVWRAAISALQQRYELSVADETSLTIATETPAAIGLLVLQIESLCEMCWTIQRKDVEGASSPQAQDLDVFTRLAWSSKSSNETKIFCTGTVSCIGVRYRTASSDAMTSCARFCCGMLTEPKNDLDVKAEAANSLMDLFDDESYDATLYIPMQLHQSLYHVLNSELSPAIRAAKRAGSRSQFEKIHEIADNLQRFLQYKEKHCTGLHQ